MTTPSLKRSLQKLLVGHIERRLVDVERIAVFHDEFAGAHDAKPRSNLVTELRLNLKEVAGKLLVAAYLATKEVCNHFFVGWAGIPTSLAARTIDPVIQSTSVLLWLRTSSSMEVTWA